MRTLGKPEGAARRAALGGITAGFMIGLAACGTTVAGTGTAASGPASHAPAARPSASGVNPGGVMIGGPPARDTALCRAVPRLTRLTFMRSTRPGMHVREILPAGFTITKRATVQQLARLLCALPTVPPGVMSCPNDMGASYRLFFVAGTRSLGAVTIELSGCRVVTGLGPPRSWATSTALEQALSQHFGVHFPLGP